MFRMFTPLALCKVGIVLGLVMKKRRKAHVSVTHDKTNYLTPGGGHIIRKLERVI